jgi:hypothetical protein
MCMCKALKLYTKGVRTECWLLLGMVICESIDQKITGVELCSQDLKETQWRIAGICI